jgi:type II secretory pathway predicted ATPase ExeA
VLPPQLPGQTSLEETTAWPADSLPVATGTCAYADFYAFVEPPFSLTPNTRFVFWGGSVSVALEQVMLGLRAGEGLMVITGDTGTGKTMLCRALAHHLRQHTFLSMVVNPTLDATDLLKQILDDFGVTSNAAHQAARTNYELFRTLEQFLVARIPQGDRAVVLIDEAHHLNPQVLEQIRLLTNLEGQDAKLLQIILVGRRDLDAMLARPELRELDQRVSRRCELQPLTPIDIHRYINHRLAVAQAPSTNTVDDPTPVQPVLMSGGTSQGLLSGQVAFTADALAVITRLSRGVPRIINLLCDRALEGAYKSETHVIESTHVVGGAARLRLNAPRATWMPDARMVATAAAVAAAAVMIVAGVATRSRWLPSLASAPRKEAISAPVAAQPAPVTGVLEAGRPVTLAVASVRDEQQPAQLVAKLAALGLPAFDRFSPSSGWHRIAVGPYLSADEARVAARQITGVGFTNDPIVMTAAVVQKDVQKDVQKAGQQIVQKAVRPPAVDAAGPASALARVVMLVVGDRASLALELRDAGVEAATQSADATTLVIDMGPVTGSVLPQELEAEAGTPCVARVSIQGTDKPNLGRFVRARVALRSACSSQKRVAGRRVYIDFAAPGSAPVAPGSAPAAPALSAKSAAAPPAPATAPVEADVLGKARALAQQPDVRGLLRLRDDVERRGKRAGQLESEEFKRMLGSLDRYTNEARALQLQIDAQAFRGLATPQEP